MTPQEKEYSDYIDGLNLRHFSGSEFIAYARRHNSGGYAGIPPKYLWDNIVPTMQVLDQLRAYLGKSITLTSIYRSEGYNNACGGATKSQHKEFRACDIQVSGVSPRSVYDRLMKMRQAGAFKGGLGLYSTFVHIDTRGDNCQWGS